VADYDGISSKHAQLAANTVDTVTLVSDYSQVEVINRDGAAEIYFTVDGAAPTVGGDNTHMIPAAISGMTANAYAESGSPTVVRLISAGTPQYTVRGVS
jgi:hypothetical protein